MRPSKIDLLLALVERNALRKSVKTSERSLALELRVSQQTISRWLNELSAESLVERTQFGIRLSKKAEEHLNRLCEAFSRAKKAGVGRFFVEGTVSPGLRDGGYYLSLPEYTESVRKALGFKPFPGTLNLKITSGGGVKARLRESASKKITGFQKNRQVFGSALLFPALVGEKIKGGVIIPERSHYGEDVLELISASNLRKTLRLRDGSRLSVEIFS